MSVFLQPFAFHLCAVEERKGAHSTIHVMATELHGIHTELPVNNLEQTDLLGNDASTELSIAADRMLVMDLDDPEELWRQRTALP